MEPAPHPTIGEYAAAAIIGLIAALSVLLVLAKAASGQVVRVERGNSIGSGTVFEAAGKHAWVLTAAHVLDDRGPIIVTARGKRYAARIIKADKLWDVAYLVIDNPGIPARPLAKNKPRIGEVLWVEGLRSGRQRGWLNQWFAPAKSEEFDLLGLSGAQARSGDSGGAVVDSAGRLVGVVTAGGSPAAPCVATCSGRIFRIFCGPPNCPPQTRPIVAVPPPPTSPLVALPPAREPAPESPPIATLPPQPPAVQNDIEPLKARVEALSAQIEALTAILHGKAFTAQIIDDKGGILESLDVPLGGTLPIRFETIQERDAK